jgi:hypothetical protein
MLADEIPGKLLDSLPPDYVLAKYTGTLWCYRDMNGGLVRDKSNPGKQFLKPGKSFKSELAQSKRSRTLQIFIPQGYPHVFCKIPREDQIEIYNRTWFLLWLPYLSEWQQREKELEGLLSYGSSIQELANDMKLRIKDIDTQEQLANQATRDLADKNYYLYGILSQECLNESRGLFNRSNTGACEKKALIQQAEDAARNSANQGSGIPAASQPASQPSPLEPISNQPRTKPPFALEGKYDRSKDPFLNVLNTNTLDVSSKTWATDEMSAGKYLDAELASQIDKVNAQLADPSILEDKMLQAEIKSLRAMGFSQIQVVSGARTPLRQAYLAQEQKKKDKPIPVARYTGSDHLFGQAADMVMPPGWGWNTDQHKKLRAVLGKLGLLMAVKDDPVHFTLKNPSNASKLNRIKMIRSYLDFAADIKVNQENQKVKAMFEESKILEQKDQLQSDFKARHTALLKSIDNYNIMVANHLSLTQALYEVGNIKRIQNEAAAKNHQAYIDSIIKLAEESKLAQEAKNAKAAGNRPNNSRGSGGTDGKPDSPGRNPSGGSGGLPPSDPPKPGMKDPWGGAEIGPHDGVFDADDWPNR